MESLVAAVPDFVCGIGAEEGVDSEATAKLEVGPIVERIAERVGNSFGPGVEFFPWGSIAGDVFFRDALSTHGPPFVVVMTEPEFGDVLPALVVGDFIGRKVRVVVDDWKVLCRIMEKVLCSVAEEEEVFVEVSSGHGWSLESVAWLWSFLNR